MKTIIQLILSFFLLTSLPMYAADSLLTVPIKTIEGTETSLTAYEGKVLLIVNVASKCGMTKQYPALESLHQKYQAQGLMVLGFPCNQFREQEPGTNEEIAKFCSAKYNVTFPLFEKLEVNGENRHPLYVFLAGESSPTPGDIRWNFTKFLVARDGKVSRRFDSVVTPDSPEIVSAIEAALAGK